MVNTAASHGVDAWCGLILPHRCRLHLSQESKQLPARTTLDFPPQPTTNQPPTAHTAQVPDEEGSRKVRLGALTTAEVVLKYIRPATKPFSCRCLNHKRFLTITDFQPLTIILFLSNTFAPLPPVVTQLHGCGRWRFGSHACRMVQPGRAVH